MLLLQMETSSIKLAQPKEREERLFMTLNEASQQRTRLISLTDLMKLAPSLIEWLECTQVEALAKVFPEAGDACFTSR